jgi:hypothetical protein
MKNCLNYFKAKREAHREHVETRRQLRDWNKVITITEWPDAV